MALLRMTTPPGCRNVNLKNSDDGRVPLNEIVHTLAPASPVHVTVEPVGGDDSSAQSPESRCCRQYIVGGSGETTGTGITIELSPTVIPAAFAPTSWASDFSIEKTGVPSSAVMRKSHP